MSGPRKGWDEFLASEALDPEQQLMLREQGDPERLEELKRQKDRRRIGKWLAQVGPLLLRLRESDVRILRLIYVLERTQEEAGKELGITQQGLSYRLAHALDRLRFFAELPQYEPGDFRRDLGHLLDQRSLRAVMVYWETVSIPQVADAIASTRRNAQKVLLHAVERMQDTASTEDYARAFTTLMSESVGYVD
jgi:hypothetical protein